MNDPALMAAIARRRRVLAGGGGSSVDANQTTLTAASFTFTGDGVTTDTLTLTTKDSGGTVVPSVAWTATVERVSLDAAAGLVSVTPASILNDGVESADISALVVDEDGFVAPGVTVTLSATGTGNTVTQPGAVTNGFGTATGSIVSTVAATKVLSATAAGQTITDTASLSVTSSSGQPALIMASSFKRGGLGTDATDVQDGTYWDGNYTNNGGAEVVASTGTDFPADANVLRFTPLIGTAGAVIIEKESLGTPAVLDSRYYRWYWRHMWPYTGNSDADNTHPIQDGTGGIGGISWYWDIHTLSGDTTFDCGFGVAVSNGENTFSNSAWRMTTALDKDTVYRFEVRVHRLSTTTFNLHAKVFLGDSTTELHGDSDFTNTNGGNTSSLADLPTLNFRAAGSGVDGADTLSLIKAGCNGIIDSVVSTEHYADQTGFAISDEDWIGPYVTAEADV